MHLALGLLLLLLRQLVLLSVDCFGKGARLHMEVVEVDWLCVKKTIWVHLRLLKQDFGVLATNLWGLVIGRRFCIG